MIGNLGKLKLLLLVKIYFLNLLIELHYLPSLEYFCALLPYAEIRLEKYEHYIKQSFRNRCYIKTSQGIEMLTIPLTAKHGKTIIKDVRIDYNQKWQNNHWRTIESAYRKAPFYEYYSDELKTILYRNHEFLFDLNYELLSFCLKSLKLNLNLSASVSYEKTPNNKIIDLRNRINAKKSFHDRPFLRSNAYYQVFGNGFAENLSLIDLLFCEGPRATTLLRSSIR